jgi:hypothetical protein
MKKTRKTKVAVEEEKDDTKCANVTAYIIRMRIGFSVTYVISGMIGFDKTWMDEASFEALGDSDWYCEKCCT